MAHSFSHFSDKTSLLRLSDLLLAIIGQAEGFLEKKTDFGMKNCNEVKKSDVNSLLWVCAKNFLKRMISSTRNPKK